MGTSVSDIVNGGATLEHPKPKLSMGGEKLRSLLDRAVRVETERKELGDALKDLYTEAKSAGYDPKAMRVLVKRELETPEKQAKRQELEMTVEMMEAALGEFSTSPLGAAAIQSVRKQ
jgi:uncharacterized protein (UPF0335 family)